MLYTIANDKITVSVSDMGAELQSIRTADGTEFLWQGDPTYWSGRAYNLFPICGRLTQGKYTYNGKEYEMNLHGFARKTQYSLLSQSSDSIAFRLTQSEKSLAMYPFDFELTITYTLKGSGVETAFSVRNTDSKELIFAVGGHPGFNIPFADDGTVFEDYFLEFDCVKPVKAITMSPTCYTTRDEQPFPLKDGKILPLRHNLFDNDAIVLADMCRAVTIKNTKNGRFVRMEYPDMSYLGIWHAPKTEAPYVCVEPWGSVPAYDGEIDALETKRDMQHLAPGAVYTNRFTIYAQ